MKRKLIISLVVILVLGVLFFPIYKGSYDDGGTRVYDALTYKIVVWNKLYVNMAEDNQPAESTAYKKTSVYWFPHNIKSIDELWQMEIAYA